MKKVITLAFLVTVVFSSCSRAPEQILADAKAEIEAYESIRFKEIKTFLDPMGNENSKETQYSFTRNTGNEVGYDFASSSDRGSTTFIGGKFKQANQEQKTIYTFAPEDEAQQIPSIQNFLRVSPISFFKNEDWAYVGDTIINDQPLADFFRVENDKVVDGNTIYTEQHIFINPETNLVESYERRNYFNGEHSQTIWYRFEEYILDENAKQISYQMPSNFRTSYFGRSYTELLKVGEKAPSFSGVDLNNKEWKLEDYRGKKVLLDFSVINCGYCLESLKYFNQEDFQLASNIEAVYINQEDSKEQVEQFKEKIGIPFPAIPEAQDIAQKYGVNSWPLFYLIDEEGIIEEVIVGFDKEKIQALEAE